MRSFPIDINAFMGMVRGVSAIDPVVDFDTGEHKRDRNGVPKWRLEVLIREPRATKSDVAHINFTAAEAPLIDHTAQLVITGLTGRAWSNENNYGYSSGVSMSADSVSFRPATASNGNGRRPAPAESVA